MISSLSVVILAALPAIAMPVTWGRQKSMDVAGALLYGPTCNLACIIDAERQEQIQLVRIPIRPDEVV